MPRAFLWSCLACFVSAPTAVSQAALPSIEAISAAWDAQGQKYKSVKLTWTDKIHRTGFVSAGMEATMAEMQEYENLARTERGELPRPVVINRNQFHFENRFEFVREGLRVRLDKTGMRASLNRNEPELDNQSVSYNGTKIRWRQEKFHNGKDQFSDHDIDFNNGFAYHFPVPSFGKVLMGKLFRPGDALRKMKFAVEPHGPVQDQPAIQLTFHDERGDWAITYVLIPSLDYAIAEYESRMKKANLDSYRATFDVNRNVMPFVPQLARFESVEDGRVVSSTERTFARPNVTGHVPDSFFEIDWPTPVIAKPGK